MLQFDASTSGFDVTELRIRGLGERLKKDIVEAISEAANEAETLLTEGAPQGETGRLKRSVKNNGVSFHPGGLGGGGFYEVDVSVGEGVPYLRHVVEGTGIHAGRGNIQPATKSQMHWEGGRVWGNPQRAKKGIDGTQHWAFETQGQKPQDEWITAANVKANEVIERKVREIDSRHDG